MGSVSCPEVLPRCGHSLKEDAWNKLSIASGQGGKNFRSAWVEIPPKWWNSWWFLRILGVCLFKVERSVKWKYSEKWCILEEKIGSDDLKCSHRCFQWGFKFKDFELICLEKILHCLSPVFLETSRCTYTLKPFRWCPLLLREFELGNHWSSQSVTTDISVTHDRTHRIEMYRIAYRTFTYVYLDYFTKIWQIYKLPTIHGMVGMLCEHAAGFIWVKIWCVSF